MFDCKLENAIFKAYGGDIFSKNDVAMTIEPETQKRIIPSVIPSKTLTTFIFIWYGLPESGTYLKKKKRTLKDSPEKTRLNYMHNLY